VNVETLFSIGDDTLVALTDENKLFVPKSLLSSNWLNAHVLASFLESATDLWKTLDERVNFLYVLHDCNSYTAVSIPMILDSILLPTIRIRFRISYQLPTSLTMNEKPQTFLIAFKLYTSRQGRRRIYLYLGECHGFHQFGTSFVLNNNPNVPKVCWNNFLTINMGTLPFKNFHLHTNTESEWVYVQEVATYATSKFRDWETQDIKNSHRLF